MIVVLGTVAGICQFLFKTPVILLRYLASIVVKPSALKEKMQAPYFSLSLFLFACLMLCLAPAISTIRLEQRWLTASFSIFMLLFVILLSSIPFKTNVARCSVYAVFIFSVIWVNFTYLHKGISNTYMHSSEMTASQFKQAVDNNVIRPNTKKLYIWEKKRDQNSENGLMWTLAGGYFFKFFSTGEKEMIFVDSTYQKTDSAYVTSFPGFDTSTSQIVLWGPELKEITGEYLRDSLKSFMANK